MTENSAARQALKALQAEGYTVETLADIRALNPRVVMQVRNIGRRAFETIFGPGSWVRTARAAYRAEMERSS